MAAEMKPEVVFMICDIIEAIQKTDCEQTVVGVFVENRNLTIEFDDPIEE